MGEKKDSGDRSRGREIRRKRDGERDKSDWTQNCEKKKQKAAQARLLSVTMKIQQTQTD